MTARQKRLLHYWVSIPGGVLFALWILSGTAMVYDSIRGGLHAFPNVKKAGDVRDVALAPAALTRNVQGHVSRLVLMTVGGRAYAQATTNDGVVLIDATNGALLSPVTEPTARALLAGYEGATPTRIERITSRGYEYHYGELPAWRGEFPNGRIIHIAASSGEVQSWTDREGMVIRAMYYWFHAFQFTSSNGINAVIAFIAIAWALASVVSGFILYKRGGAVVATALVLVFAPQANAATTPFSPQRIVTLAPSCAEVVAGVGLGDKLVGVTDYTDWPPRVTKLPKVGSFKDFSIEAVAALKPDLVVATDDGNPQEALLRIQRLGVRVIRMKLQSYADIEESIVAFGDAVGRTAQARAVVAEMKRVETCVANRTAKVTKPRVLLAYEMAPIVTAGAGSFTDQLITKAGGASITHDVALPYPRLTIESVVARKPDVIIVSSMNPQMDLRRWMDWLSKWPTIPAVQQKRVHIIDSTNVDRPSQRVILGLTLLARTIHPTLFAHGECRANLPG